MRQNLDIFDRSLTEEELQMVSRPPQINSSKASFLLHFWDSMNYCFRLTLDYDL
ncbi:hypothetical protein RchiOBHm_Chr4g0445471 [Rosa chinensis]|uniref:Uncharacterized protein n=1 Tax=Rosa chinensis TaxID=74649 RepID=A0A2P6R4E0_ROSCH|nr:hypothetical protein RchiOBHm_Chr4g0445471 [Rosa chinensis]